MSAANLPVIVGAGQYVNRSRDLADAVAPLAMMATLARPAPGDPAARGRAARSAPPGLAGERRAPAPAQRVCPAVGGDTPQRLINKPAEAIVRGETRLALVCGAEALATTRLSPKMGASLPRHA